MKLERNNEKHVIQPGMEETGLRPGIYRFISSYLLIFCPLLGFLLLFPGCVRESTEDCTDYSGTLSIILPDGRDITSDSTVVSTVGVYQFESDGFVRQVPWSRDAMVAIGVETEKSLVLVAWGNLQTDTLQVIPPSVGAPPDSAQVHLRTKADGYQYPAPDLFYGRYEKVPETTRSLQRGNDGVESLSALTRAQTQIFSLVMERKVSALSVRILHLAEHFEGVAGTLRLLVDGTCSSLNFRGEAVGKTAVYAPPLQAVPGADEWDVPLFRIFPTPPNGGMTLKLYRNDALVLTITSDDEGNLLQAISGKEVHITIDFRYSRLHVGMRVEPWGNTEQEVVL